MMMLMPLMTLWFGFMMPAALGLYWLASMLFGIVQDVWLNNHYRKILDAEEAVRTERERKKEAEIEAKRQETERLRAENATVANPNTSKKKQQKQVRLTEEQKAAEWKKQHKPNDKKAEEPSRVGNRPYARGRAYDPDRFQSSQETLDSVEEAEETLPVEKPVFSATSAASMESLEDVEYEEDDPGDEDVLEEEDADEQE